MNRLFVLLLTSLILLANCASPSDSPTVEPQPETITAFDPARSAYTVVIPAGWVARHHSDGSMNIANSGFALRQYEANNGIRALQENQTGGTLRLIHRADLPDDIAPDATPAEILEALTDALSSESLTFGTVETQTINEASVFTRDALGIWGKYVRDIQAALWKVDDNTFVLVIYGASILYRESYTDEWLNLLITTAIVEP